MLGENRKTSEKKKQTNISSFFAPLPVKRSIQETPDLSKKLKYSSMIILDQEEPTRSSPIQPTLVVSTPLVSTSPTVSMKISSSPLVSSKISSTPITSTPSISKKAPKFTPSSTPLEKPSFKQKNEERYSWLLNVQDKQLRNQDDPLYDPSTLFIPPQSLRKLSDFERQFWEIKAAHFNQVVFFKKGKFYELYENDADIASREFGLKMVSRVNMRMAGVPESSFDNWAQQFVDKGLQN